MLHPLVELGTVKSTNLLAIMDNRQTVQSQPSEENTTPSKSGSKPFKLPGNWSILLHLLEHYPWLAIVALLGLFVGGSVLSVYSLGYAGKVEHPQQAKVIEPKPESDVQLAVPQQTVLPSSQNNINNPNPSNNPIDLWMVAAIALSCASGCLIILRFMKLRSQPQKVQRTTNRYEARQSQRRQQVPQRFESRVEKRNPVQQKPSFFVPPQPKKYNPQVFVPPQQQVQNGVMAIPRRTQPVVTVIPPEPRQNTRKNHGNNQNHQPSLADVMDIRQHSPLSSILRK